MQSLRLGEYEVQPVQRPNHWGDLPSKCRLRSKRRSSTPRCEEAGRQVKFQVGNQDSDLTIELKTNQRSVWASYRRCGPGSLARCIDRSEVAGILCRPTEHCFFVKRIFRVGKTRRSITPRLGNMCMWMKNHLRPPADCPSHRLRVSPSLVANHNSKSQRTSGKNRPLLAEGRVNFLLRWIELTFILPSRDCSIGVEYAS